MFRADARTELFIKKLHIHWYYGFPVALVLIFGVFVKVYGRSPSLQAAPKCIPETTSTCPSSAGNVVLAADRNTPPLALDLEQSPPEQPAVTLQPGISDQTVNSRSAWERRIERLTLQAQDRLFSSRFHGPYAISVLDRLNEMAIGTTLKVYGISTDDAPLRLGDPVLSAIPSSMPAYGYISSSFGPRRSPFGGHRVQHNGIDIAVNSGSPVYATADGIVTLSGNRYAMGKTVIINHGFGIVTRYGHNSRLLVKAGDFVQKGQQIALSGNTGRSTGAHLHYEVWVNDEVVDPTKFMFDVPPAALTPTVALASSQSKTGLTLGFAVGGDPEGGAVHRDWFTEIGRQRQGQTVTTLFILSLFAAMSAGIVLLAARSSTTIVD